tara:strand:+ start:44 stop:235 length:192 start_codon:yes stop_codon:yes gene_type:complete
MTKNKKYLKIINAIEKTRKKNNSNWMDLMRLSFRYNPIESKKIVKNIFKEDKKINKLIKKLVS